MKKKTSKSPRRGIYSVFIIGLSVLTLLMTAVTGWVIYPSEVHRQTAQSITKLNEKAYNSDTKESDKIYNSNEYKSLIDSPENNHTTIVTLVTSILSFVLSAVAIVLVSRYLRNKRVAKNAASATIWLIVMVNLITYLPALYISEAFSGITIISGGSHFVLSLLGLPFALIITALLTYIVVRATEITYNRSHGFIDE